MVKVRSTNNIADIESMNPLGVAKRKKSKKKKANNSKVSRKKTINAAGAVDAAV